MRPRERFESIREGLNVSLSGHYEVHFFVNSSSLGPGIRSIGIRPPVWHVHFKRPHEFKCSRTRSGATEVSCHLQAA